MANSLSLKILNTGSSSSIYIGDIHDGKDQNGRVNNRKPYQYIPPNGAVSILFTEQVQYSYESGSIRAFIDQGLIQTFFEHGDLNYVYSNGGQTYHLDVTFQNGTYQIDGGSNDSIGTDISVFAGNSSANGETGGSIEIQAGLSSNGNGGSLDLSAGLSEDGTGGSIAITAGDGDNGGNITLKSGVGSAGGNTSGNVILEPALGLADASNGKVVFKNYSNGLLTVSSENVVSSPYGRIAFVINNGAHGTSVLLQSSLITATSTILVTPEYPEVAGLTLDKAPYVASRNLGANPHEATIKFDLNNQSGGAQACAINYIILA